MGAAHCAAGRLPKRRRSTSARPAANVPHGDPSLHGYLLDLYQLPGIPATVNLDHIKRHYYLTHDDINPTRLVPLGPELDFSRPHGRAGLSV